MSEELKKDKDFIVAKMSHRTTIMTTIIGSIVTLIGVFTPIYLNNNMKSDAAADVQSKESTSSTQKEVPTPTTSPTPTSTQIPTQSKGKGKEK